MDLWTSMSPIQLFVHGSQVKNLLNFCDALNISVLFDLPPLLWDLLFQAVTVNWCTSRKDHMCDSLRLRGCLPGSSSVHGDSPGTNTGVGCHALLQGSSPPSDWTHVFCIAGRFFTVWATREALTDHIFTYVKLAKTETLTLLGKEVRIIST